MFGIDIAVISDVYRHKLPHVNILLMSSQEAALRLYLLLLLPFCLFWVKYLLCFLK